MADFNIDLAAFVFRALGVVPFVEIRPALKTGYITPAIRKVGLDLCGYRFGLRLPELVCICEHTMLAEQVGGDLPLIV